MTMTSDVQLEAIHIRLDPGGGRLPLRPMLQSVRADISPSAFEKLCRIAVKMADARVPLDLDLLGSELTDGGAIVRARAKKGLLRADIQARIGIASVGPRAIRLTLEQLDAPVWVPTNFVIEHAFEVAAAKPGITRVPGETTAVDVDPETLLNHLDLPSNIQRPGTWTVYPTFQSIGLHYQADGL
jgi:hypothetical protein